MMDYDPSEFVSCDELDGIDVIIADEDFAHALQDTIDTLDELEDIPY